MIKRMVLPVLLSVLFCLPALADGARLIPGTATELPKDIDGFYEINGQHQKISLAYFTTVTRDQPWVRGLSDPTAPEYSWYQVFSAGKVPGNFPLTHGRFLAGSDQLILADRPRW